MQGKLLFLLAILIGFYSLSIFFLGLAGQLKPFFIGSVSIIFLFTVVFFGLSFRSSVGSLYAQAKKNSFYFSIFLVLMLVNIVGTLGPELGFDALWYHLVIPQRFIKYGSVEFIPGGLLDYSVMPKIIDLLYIPALMFSNETGAKVIHFAFGILTSIVTYKTANLFVNKRLSYLTAIIFYSNLVVGWMSITAYIDLGRAFFGSLSIYFFILYYKTKEIKYLYYSSAIVGFEITSKLIGFSTLISLMLATLFFSNSKNLIGKVKEEFVLIIFPLLLLIPWILFSYVNTGNLFYPFLSSIYPSLDVSSINPFLFFKHTFELFLFSADPISPIYLISLPLVLIMFRKIPNALKLVLFISLTTIIIWNFIPQKNSRFIVPYLPIFSVLVVWIISKSLHSIKNILYIFVFISVFISIVYRGIANAKYLPVIFGLEPKEKFLERNLNFSFGDYLDIDSKVSEIVEDEKVLIKGIHNLYYVDFKYDHDSWANEKEYKYILSKGVLSGEKDYNLVYTEEKTDTYLYEKN